MVIIITVLSSPVPKAMEKNYDNNINGNVLLAGLSSPVPQAVGVIYGHNNNNWVVFSCSTSNGGNL